VHALMTPAQRDRQIEKLLEAAIVLRTLPVQTPCSQCEHFAVADAHCARWGQQVPTDARDAGCAEWREGVPF
jgi:hypothetical protein